LGVFRDILAILGIGIISWDNHVMEIAEFSCGVLRLLIALISLILLSLVFNTV
jgi:hypothetical protein